MHCHVRKDIVLLCLAGHGATSFLDGETVPISAGSWVYIERGVFHRTQAAPDSHLDLIEVEKCALTTAPAETGRLRVIELAATNARQCWRSISVAAFPNMPSVHLLGAFTGKTDIGNVPAQPL